MSTIIHMAAIFSSLAPEGNINRVVLSTAEADDPFRILYCYSAPFQNGVRALDRTENASLNLNRSSGIRFMPMFRVSLPSIDRTHK